MLDAVIASTDRARRSTAAHPLLNRRADDGVRPARRELRAAACLRTTCSDGADQFGRLSGRHRDRRGRPDRGPSAPARTVLAAQHLLQIGDVGRRLVRRQIGLDDGFGLGEAALQADHQAQILPHPRVGLAAGVSPAKNLLGLRQILGKHVGQAEVGQHRGLLGHDLQGAGVIAAGFVMPAELVERGALHRQDAPVGIVGRMGAAEHVERLLEIAVIGERAAIAGEQCLVAGMGDGGLFEHGDGLGALPGGAQRLADRPARRRHPWGWRDSVRRRLPPRAADRHREPALASAFDVSDPVMSDMVWQPPRPAAKIAVMAADARSRARLEC